MHDVLKRILARKQEEVAERSARVPLAELQARRQAEATVQGLGQVLAGSTAHQP